MSDEKISRFKQMVVVKNPLILFAGFIGILFLFTLTDITGISKVVGWGIIIFLWFWYFLDMKLEGDLK